MTAQQNQLPKWVFIVSGIIAVLEIMVSISLCFLPESVADNVDLSAKGVMYLLYMWAARQFALGVIFAWATIKRSAAMLTTCYIFFLVMMIGDLVVGVVEKQNAMIIAALVMGIISAAILYVINKRKEI